MFVFPWFNLLVLNVCFFKSGVCMCLDFDIVEVIEFMITIFFNSLCSYPLFSLATLSYDLPFNFV